MSVVKIRQETRRWQLRLVNFGLAPDGTHRGVRVCEVWQVDDRPTVYRTEAIILDDGCRPGEPLSAAVSRIDARLRHSVWALARPVLALTDIRISVDSDYPSLDEQLESLW